MARAGAMVMLSAWAALCSVGVVVSVALTTKAKVPAVDGVPERSPGALRVVPGGIEPEAVCSYAFDRGQGGGGFVLQPALDKLMGKQHGQGSMRPARFYVGQTHALSPEHGGAGDEQTLPVQTLVAPAHVAPSAVHHPEHGFVHADVGVRRKGSGWRNPEREPPPFPLLAPGVGIEESHLNCVRHVDDAGWYVKFH